MLNIKKLTFFIYFLLFSHLLADESLYNLLTYDKESCLKLLNKASTQELWNVFLEGQAELNFEPEFQNVAHENWWQKAHTVLDIGCGNGAYLAKVASQFPSKQFLGIEKLPAFVKHAKEKYATSGLVFEEGDAEILDDSLQQTADVVLFRLVLQHLQNPILALENSWHYLAPNGHIFIIDSFDPATSTSHPISELNRVMALVAQKQSNSNKGHRKISLEVLKQIENQTSHLCDLFQIIYTNINANGDKVAEISPTFGEEARTQFFNHTLLFAILAHRTFQVPVDLSKVYDELVNYVADENAWSIIGMHCLILQKI